MLTYMTVCQHGIMKLLKRPTTEDGLSNSYTVTLGTFGNTTSIPRILTSLPICRVCTQVKVTTGFTHKGKVTISRATPTGTYFYTAHLVEPIRTLGHYRTGHGQGTFSDPT